MVRCAFEQPFLHISAAEGSCFAGACVALDYFHTLMSLVLQDRANKASRVQHALEAALAEYQALAAALAAVSMVMTVLPRLSPMYQVNALNSRCMISYSLLLLGIMISVAPRHIKSSSKASINDLPICRGV